MIRSAIAGFALTASFALAHAATGALDDAIAELGHGWARASYQTPEDSREEAFDALIARSQVVADTFPGRPTDAGAPPPHPGPWNPGTDLDLDEVLRSTANRSARCRPPPCQLARPSASSPPP